MHIVSLGDSMHTGWITLTWKQTNFSIFVLSLKVMEGTSTWLSHCSSTKESRSIQICFVLPHPEFSPFEWIPTDFSGLWYVKQTWPMTVSISFLHLQPQLISSHSVDLLEIKQPWPWLCVRLVWEGGGDGIRFWRLVLMTLIMGPFFICQSAEWHYTFLSHSLFAYSFICHMRGPDNPPSGDEW